MKRRKLVIDKPIAELVRQIEGQTENSLQMSNLIIELISRLKLAFNHSEIIDQYASYNNTSNPLGSYPLDKDGFTKAFDPLEQEEEFIECWSRYGIVASKGVVSRSTCGNTISEIYKSMQRISNDQCNLSQPETWGNMPVDNNGTPIISRGFFEIYQDHMLATLRQAIRVYIHYALIWGKADLWTTFDRLGVKLPGHDNAKRLPLHVDQNPNFHAGFQTVQGVLALTDCPAERGTFIGVPGSKSLFTQYADIAEDHSEYVELNCNHPSADKLHSHEQLFPLRAGDLISWDSRTTHAASANISNQVRAVAYISAGPAAENDQAAIAARLEAFKTGQGPNVPNALIRKSKKPRYMDTKTIAHARTSEKLTLLGELLYGHKKYSELEYKITTSAEC